MTIDSFAEMTRAIIARDGFDEYLPTACYPVSRRVVVLRGYPDDIVPESVVRQFANDGRAKGEPCLVAFKIDSHRFQVDLFDGNRTESRVFELDQA